MGRKKITPFAERVKALAYLFPFSVRLWLEQAGAGAWGRTFLAGRKAGAYLFPFQVRLLLEQAGAGARGRTFLAGGKAGAYLFPFQVRLWLEQAGAGARVGSCVSFSFFHAQTARGLLFFCIGYAKIF